MSNSDSSAMIEIDGKLDSPMTDVWDIAQYVEAHPDNNEQRWRLAKKLYMAWEYRLALEHLQVLKNEWDRKINVCRYLAATYYRLSRYDDAIRELESAISEWPEELGLHEQLARTLDVAGRKPEAVEVWEKIVRQEPNHPFAKRAVEHLRKKQIEEQRAEDPNSSAAAAVASLMETSCPHCGAMNSPEFKRCWQCHSSLVDGAEPEKEVLSAAALAEEESSSPWGLVAGLAIAGLLALGVYLTLRALSAQESTALATGVPETLFAFLSSTLFTTRWIVGLTALVVWPILWRVSAMFVGLDEVYNDVLYRCGLLMAVVTYAVSWVPGSMIYLLAVVPTVLSAALAFGTLRAPALRAFYLWVVQGVAMVLVVIALLAGWHGIGIVTDIPAMFRFASSEAATSIEGEAWTPLELGMRWEPSGSDWLDRNATAVRISIETAPHDKTLSIELLEDGKKICVFREFTSESYVVDYSPIIPGLPYRLLLVGEEGIDAKVAVKGTLQVGPMVPE